MKAIIDKTKLERHVSREQMRRFNHKTHGNYSRDDIERIMMLQRLKMGQLDEQDVRTMAKNRVAHLDNEEAFPNGTEVMLNVDAITSRPKTDMVDEYWDFVNQNKETVFHLAREENAMNLVCLEEDNRTNSDGEPIPKWLFDMFADLLVKNQAGEWVSPFEIDDHPEIENS